MSPGSFRLCCAAFALALVSSAFAGEGELSGGIPTTVRVRAVSRDAKILSSAVGGARITIRDEATGTVLAEGFQEGGSGETDAIMLQPRRRHASVYDTPGAGLFEATLSLESPTVVEITAEGPLGYPQATRTAAKTMLLVPGENILGDGVLLEIHGFIVEIESPPPDSRPAAGHRLEIRATVRMSCGCPTEPGGLWDAGGIRVLARLVRGSRILSEAELAPTGETSGYGGTLPLAAPGPVDLVVLALDPETANFGRFRRKLRIAMAPSE
jgi:hypothetical protein